MQERSEEAAKLVANATWLSHALCALIKRLEFLCNQALIQDGRLSRCKLLVPPQYTFGAGLLQHWFGITCYNQALLKMAGIIRPYPRWLTLSL